MIDDTAEHFTSAHSEQEDGSMAFDCATDPDNWPWLRLAPRDPIVIQTLNYYGAYEIAVVRGEYQPNQWTALTDTWWKCGEPGAGHAVRGVAHARESADDAGYRVSFFDRQGALSCEVGGVGVVFRNRDFAAWRQQQKQAMKPPVDPRTFAFVSPQRVGVLTPVESYIAELEPGSPAAVQALVTERSGFPPEHPYHDGSGDHVNAAHLADASRQFLCLVRNQPDLVFSAGEMQFRAYVELGRPFRLELEAGDAVEDHSSVVIRQADQICATVQLHIA